MKRLQKVRPGQVAEGDSPHRKVHKKIQINGGLAAAWAIPTVIMLAIFFIKSIYPFGGRSFLYMDMYHQYMPFYSQLHDKLREGGSLYYTWNVGIGSNFLALYVYYLACPLHFLGVLVPKAHIMEFLSYLVVCKVGLCGLTACLYLQRHFHTRSFGCVLFSCFYALSGFMAAYNWNIMWLDPVILLPLVLLGLELLVKEGRCGLYCVALALSIYTNFYLSIMVCIFLVLYFLVLLFTEKRSVKILGDFALFSLLAGGMAAVLLVPEACALLATDFGHSSFPTEVKTYFSVLAELARHCMCVSAERGLDHWPNIYCGVAAFLLVPLYTVNPGIPMRRRFANLALAGFMLVSFGTNVMDFLWHGFNYPDSLPGRQTFLYIFLILTLCYECFRHLRDLEPKYILYSYLGTVLFLLCCQQFVEHEDFSDEVWLATLLFVTVDAILLYFYRTRGIGEEQAERGITCLRFVPKERGEEEAGRRDLKCVCPVPKEEGEERADQEDLKCVCPVPKEEGEEKADRRDPKCVCPVPKEGGEEKTDQEDLKCVCPVPKEDGEEKADRRDPKCVCPVPKEEGEERADRVGTKCVCPAWMEEKEERADQKGAKRRLPARRREEWRMWLAVLTLLAVVLETGINTFHTSVGTTSRSAYLGQLGNYEELYDLARQREAVAGNGGIFRMEKFVRTTKNDGTLAGYPTASVFSSTMNSAVADLYERLGMRHSKVYYCYDGATAFLSALLNVNYLYGEADEEMAAKMAGGGNIGKSAEEITGGEPEEKAQSEENGLYSLVDIRGRVALYACEATLPFGYVAPVGYDLPEGYKGEPLKLQNEMVRLLGVDGTLFRRSECKQAGEKVTLTAEEDGYYYMMLTGSGTKKIAMTGALERKYSDLKIYSVLYVGYLEEGCTVTFSNDDDSDKTPEFKLTAYRMDEEVLAKALEVLGDRHLEEVSYDDTHVSGKLELTEAGRLILSIPFEKGWQIRVNGAKQEPVLVGSCLMALDLEPGSYQIDLEYVPYGLTQGILLSVVSIFTFSGIMLLRYRKKESMVS